MGEPPSTSADRFRAEDRRMNIFIAAVVLGLLALILIFNRGGESASASLPLCRDGSGSPCRVDRSDGTREVRIASEAGEWRTVPADVWEDARADFLAERYGDCPGPGGVGGNNSC